MLCCTRKVGERLDPEMMVDTFRPTHAALDPHQRLLPSSLASPAASMAQCTSLEYIATETPRGPLPLFRPTQLATHTPIRDYSQHTKPWNSPRRPGSLLKISCRGASPSIHGAISFGARIARQFYITLRAPHFLGLHMFSKKPGPGLREVNFPGKEHSNVPLLGFRRSRGYSSSKTHEEGKATVCRGVLRLLYSGAVPISLHAKHRNQGCRPSVWMPYFACISAIWSCRASMESNKQRTVTLHIYLNALFQGRRRLTKSRPSQ